MASDYDDRYLTLEELKATLEIEDTDTAADADLKLAISAASQAVESHCGRRFDKDAEDVQRLYVPHRDYWLELDDLSGPPTSIDSDQTGNTTFAAWATSDYMLEPANAVVDGQPYTALRLTPKSTPEFLPDEGVVRVTGKWGWPEVPASVKQAVSLAAARLVKRAREAPFGVTGMGADGMAVRIVSLDPDVSMLLAPFTRPLRLS